MNPDLTPSQEKEILLRMLLIAAAKNDAFRIQNEKLEKENRKLRLKIKKVRDVVSVQDKSVHKVNTYSDMRYELSDWEI